MPPPSRESESQPTGAQISSSVPHAHSEAPPAVAISATFTAEALEPTLAFWLRELHLDFQIRFAPYNQVFQQLLDPAGLFAGNRNGLNVVLVRFEDWARFRDSTRIDELDEEVGHLASAVRTAAGRADSPMLVCLCPASPEFLSDRARTAFAARSEEALRSALRDLSTVHLATTGEIQRLYPVPTYYDPQADKLGHVPYPPEFFAALGTVIARKLHAHRTSRYKVIALDCDETLWRGVCGEDGPQGIGLDTGHLALQQFMLAQRESGMLLCLCSKNNAEDVDTAFRAHPEMPLRPEHFAGSRVNWEPKSANLRSLAEELGLGIESFILVDNSATECAEVQASCPEVLTLALPANAGEFPAFLDHIWAFDRWSTTAEDRSRAALYTQEAARARAGQQSTNLAEFLASLNLQVNLAPMTAGQLPRVAQLTQRTNQMNFTSVRRTESEIQTLLQSERFECLAVDVSDRFGSYGLSGVILFRAGRNALVVDSFLLSCRALGRGVEQRMLARLGEIAKERGLAEVEIAFVPTARNRPAEALLTAAGESFQQRMPTGSTFHFPAEYLAAIEYRASHHAQPARDDRRPNAASTATLDPVDYLHIARELRDPVRILAAVRARAYPQRTLAPSDAPRSDLEKQLAKMWSTLLGLGTVGIHENFFDLGGHSLLAVQLLSLVRQTFDIDLSLKVVYSGEFTIAELAKAIELREIEGAGSAQYAGILKELEALSDEEVRTLLAAEQNGTSGGKPQK
jgi:FkbH-like protein